MNLWMDVMRDLEHLLDNYERLFDAWEAGGVTGLVVGSMNFNAAKLVPGQRHVAGVTDRTPIPDLRSESAGLSSPGRGSASASPRPIDGKASAG